MLRTRFIERYGCRHPCVGAGMAFVCETPELAVAVCTAGGIGALTAFAPPNPMRVLRNRVVAEYGDRFDEVPTNRDDLEVIGRTLFLGDEIVARKLHSFASVPETTGDWEKMPWLAAQGVGLVRDVRPAGEIVEGKMSQAAEVLSRFGA